MTTATLVNSFVDAVIARLNSNLTPLGGVLSVVEKAEDPGVIADTVADLPIIYVVPMADTWEKPVAIITGGSDAGNQHLNFPILISGYYEFDEVKPRDIRNYAYTCLDIFASHHGRIDVVTTAASATGFEVKAGYFIVNGHLIHAFKVKMYLKFIG